jgi:hypothetical protein
MSLHPLPAKVELALRLGIFGPKHACSTTQYQFKENNERNLIIQEEQCDYHVRLSMRKELYEREFILEDERLDYYRMIVDFRCTLWLSFPNEP